MTISQRLSMGSVVTHDRYSLPALRRPRMDTDRQEIHTSCGDPPQNGACFNAIHGHAQSISAIDLHVSAGKGPNGALSVLHSHVAVDLPRRGSTPATL